MAQVAAGGRRRAPAPTLRRVWSLEKVWPQKQQILELAWVPPANRHMRESLDKHRVVGPLGMFVEGMEKFYFLLQGRWKSLFGVLFKRSIVWKLKNRKFFRGKVSGG